MAGRVTVDGQPATLGQRIDPATARVELDGALVPVAPDLVYYLLNKPDGVITTADDPQGRPTVITLVPAEPRVFAVGRLDRHTEGLLVLTNDGALAQVLTHPSHGVDKEYVAEVEGGTPPPGALRALRHGVELDDGPTAPAEVGVLAPGTAISAAQSSGTAPNPISRMAVAGKMLVTSGVAVKSTLTMSSSTNSLRAMISRISSCERSVTWAAVSASTVVAPRRPLTMRAGGMAAHSTGNGSAGPLGCDYARVPVPSFAAPARARTSAAVSTRHRPGARPVSRTGPMRVRTRRRTGWPTAWHMRRT